MRRFLLFAAFSVSILTVSCTKDFKEGDDAFAELSLNSVTAASQLKSVIATDTLGAEDAAAGVGICLLSQSGSAYDGQQSYGNVRVYRIPGKWQFSSIVKLSATKGILYGYFPYDSEIEDITSIPVEASLNGTDYLYAVPVSGLDKANSSADLVMKHALSRISVKLVRDASFKGPGILSGVSFKGEAVSSSGTLNAITGEVAAEKSEVTLQGGGTVDADGLVADCLVVPVPGKNDRLPLELGCTIDGTLFPIPLPGGVSVAGGEHTTIVVSVKPEGLSVVDIWAQPWSLGYGTTGSIDGTRKVTIQLESGIPVGDVLFQGYSQGTGFVIEAFSQSGRALECSVPGNCVCIPSQDWTTGIYKFTISGFNSDITAVISYPHDDDVLNQVNKIKVRNTAFYKKILVDAGYGFDPGVSDGYTKRLPVAIEGFVVDKEGASVWDYVDCALQDSTQAVDTSFLRKFYDGYSSKTEKIDLNGPLLYPDGEPRYSLYYCMGGGADRAGLHRDCIGLANLDHLRTFFENGGSFVASGGAGAVFLGSRYEGVADPGYLSLYDAGTFWTQTKSNVTSSIILEDGSPLSGYGAEKTVSSIINNRGVYLDEQDAPAGTEILARYGTFTVSGYTNTGKAAVWAYKPSETSGRIVVCGSKPEKSTSEAGKGLFRSELAYAVEGNGLASIKGVLHNGETRRMTLKEGDPAHCAIGDGQCHHFAFQVRQTARKMYIKLDWEVPGTVLEIYLKRGSYAFPESGPDYKLLSPSSESGETSSVLELSDVPAGLWFVTVRCATIPQASKEYSRGGTDWSFYYKSGGTAAELAQQLQPLFLALAKQGQKRFHALQCAQGVDRHHRTDVQIPQSKGIAADAGLHGVIHAQEFSHGSAASGTEIAVLVIE